MARPTKFKKRYVEDMIEFFNGAPMRKEVMEVVTEFNKDGTQRKQAEKFKYMPNKMPTIYGFAKSIGVDYTTVYRWAESGVDDPSVEEKIKKGILTNFDVATELEIKRFRNAYKTAKAAQQEFLMEIGLAGAAPPAAYIFTAKNVTSMRDKVETDVTMRQVKPLLDNLNLDNEQNVHDNFGNTKGSQS